MKENNGIVVIGPDKPNKTKLGFSMYEQQPDESRDDCLTRMAKDAGMTLNEFKKGLKTFEQLQEERGKLS